ncbi:MAG: GNAT family N-acetyltransferase [Acidobacteria bacterium]|nr:GNAT family N-acetyltransferase [Acidobacteriota bacterium]
MGGKGVKRARRADSGDGCPRTGIRHYAAHDLHSLQELFREYWSSLGLSGDFQQFSEELRSLPRPYTPPSGCLLLASRGGQTVGCMALRAITADKAEAKRLFVRAPCRGLGIGKALLGRIIDEACEAGYRQLFADTLPHMKSALSLYAQTGFVQVTPYSRRPTPGAIYLELDLSKHKRSG